MEYLLMAGIIILPLVFPASLNSKIEREISKITGTFKTPGEEGVNVKDLAEKIYKR